MRIMMVDDSRVMRKSVSKILKNRNEVVEAEDGEQAWERLLADPKIKLVCCDLSMPKADGFAFLKKVRGHDQPQIRDMPVIIVTGKDDTEENRNRVFQAGATGFLSKPFDSAQLRSAIELHSRLVNTSKALQEKSAKMEELATTDELTGLGSQAFFERSAIHLVSRAKRYHRPLTIVRIAIDSFRKLFLTIGKTKSNQVLKNIGQALAKYTRDEDLLCRIGLDEFAILLVHESDVDVLQMSQRVIQMTRAIRFRHNNKPIKISVSIGIATIEASEQTQSAQLLAVGGEQLQIAQKNGGDQVVHVGGAHPPVSLSLNVDQVLHILQKSQDDQEVEQQAKMLLNQLNPLLSFVSDKTPRQFQQWLKTVSSGQPITDQASEVRGHNQ